MKKMKEISLTIAMTAFLGLLCLGFFAACTDILSGPPAGTAEGGPAGTGQALIRLGPRAEGARTLMPSDIDYENLSYTYTFSTGGRDSVSGKITREEELVVLAAGTWNLTVEGADSEGVPVLEGFVQDIGINQGAASPVNVPLKVKTGDGTRGSLHYSVSFPGTVIRGSLTAYRWEDNRKEGNPADLVSGASPERGRITAEDTLSLPAGYYRIALDLYHAEGFFSRTEIAHIYGGMTTEYSLTADDFTPAAVEEGTSFNDVLSAISGLAAGENKTYLLPAGEEQLQPTQAAAANSNGPVTVTIDGGGRVVALKDHPASHFTVGNNITLVLKNITFKGTTYRTSSYPMVTVDTGGTLETGTGVFITAHKNRGVAVGQGGTFIMNGGEISGNSLKGDYSSGSSSGSGGGVYVYEGGTFTMNGGEISGNSASNDSYYAPSNGGGVYVSSNGIFTMNGGEISGNSASNANNHSPVCGGGVYVSSNGVFTMNGGEISGNSTSANYDRDNFSYGGGVYVSESGTFTMNGGKISGNSASSNSLFWHLAKAIRSYGGGVYVSESGTFTKQPGAVIYGSDAGSTLKNTVQAKQGTSDGHAVYISETKRRNSTAGTEVTLDSSIDGAAGGWEEPLQ